MDTSQSQSLDDLSYQQFQKEVSETAIKVENIMLKVLKSAQNVLQEQQLLKIQTFVQQCTENQDQMLKSIQSLLLFLINQILLTQQKMSFSVRRQDYKVLQESIQKSEAEIRKHIRIQQQLKLYLDGIQQKNQQITKQLKLQQAKYHQLFQSMKIMDKQKRDMQKIIHKLQEKIKALNDKQKNKGNTKSSKIIAEGTLVSNSQQILSVYKNRNTLYSGYFNSKQKIDKNLDKSKNPSRKSSKLKYLHEDTNIDVGISKEHNYSLVQQNYSDQLKAQKQPQKVYLPTQSDIALFKELTKTVQMKEYYKRPVRKSTKHKTETRQKDNYSRDYRSNSQCK